MDELDKKELVNAYNKVTRSICEAMLAFECDRDRDKFTEACEKLFKRRKDLKLQAKRSGFKFVELPPSPDETEIWAEFELQELL